MKDILAAGPTVVVAAKFSTSELVLGVAVVVGGIFLFLWKKAEMGPVKAGFLVGLPLLGGMILGTLATVAKLLSSISGGKLP